MSGAELYDKLISSGLSPEESIQIVEAEYPGYTKQIVLQTLSPSHTVSNDSDRDSSEDYVPDFVIQTKSNHFVPEENTDRVSGINQPKKTEITWPMVGVGVIFLALFMPFISVSDSSMNFSGFDLLFPSNDDYEENPQDYGFDASEIYEEVLVEDEMVFFALALILLLFTPYIFLITGVIAGVMIAKKQDPKSIAHIHLGLLGVFLILSIIGTHEDYWETITVHGDFTGIGFYLASLSGILLRIPHNVSSPSS